MTYKGKKYRKLKENEYPSFGDGSISIVSSDKEGNIKVEFYIPIKPKKARKR